MSEDFLEYSGPYGTQNLDDNMWDDCGKEFKDDLIKNRITNIKIYYSNENDIKERYIIGLTFAFMNVSNGKIKVIEHKGTDNISGMKELNIKGTNYILIDDVIQPFDTEEISIMLWTDYDTIPNAMQNKYFYGTIKVYAWQEE